MCRSSPPAPGSWCSSRCCSACWARQPPLPGGDGPRVWPPRHAVQVSVASDVFRCRFLSMAERILITSALPYANGPLHIGHLVEYVQTDIYVRFLRSAGKDVVYVCADDTHGTPIELAARKEGIEPEKYVERWFDEHQRDMRDMDIRHDYYWSTHSEENRRYSELIYSRLKEAGDIERRDVEQTYCETDRRFLPDRFVRGTCPNCKSPNQYGDVCERCGKTYSPTDLIDPRCAICGNPPVRRTSAHLFFKLSRHAEWLRG